MRLLHVIETTSNPEGVFSPGRSDSGLISLFYISNMRVIALRRQFIPCIPLACSFPHLPSCHTIYINPTSTPYRPATIRRRSTLLHALANSRQCHSSAQSPSLLPCSQFYRNASCDGLGERNCHSRMEYPRRREIVSVPPRDEGGEDLFDEFQRRVDFVGGQLGA